MKKPYHILFNSMPVNRLKCITALLSVIILTGFMHLSLFAVAPAKAGHTGNATAVSAGNTLDKIGLSGSTPAAAAYSLRQLSSTYTGPVIRVRAGSTNAEADVAFDSNHTLSAASVVKVTVAGTSGYTINQTMAFSTFYGQQDVFVTTWYDQSGNALNFTQTYPEQQPAIVQAGVMVMLNNKPNILFGTSYLVVPGATIFTAGASMVGVAKGTSTRPSSFITKCNGYLPAPFDFTDVNGYFFEGDGTNYVQLLNPVLSNTTPRSDVSTTVPESVYSFTIANQGNFSYYWNGGSISNNTSTSFADIGSDMMIGNRKDGFGSGNFYSPEIVLFNSVLSDADRHTVEASQKTYYQLSAPNPFIYVVGAPAFIGNIIALAGTPSSGSNIGQITVSGSWLLGNITATAPAGFEVSLSAGSGYGASVTLTQTAGSLANTTVYVRTAASAPVGNLTGNVALTSASANGVNVAVTATVDALPTVNAVANQTVVNGTTTAPVNFTGAIGRVNWANNTPAIGLQASGFGNIGSFTAVNNGASPIIATITATPVFPKTQYVISGSLGYVQATNALNGNVLDTLKYIYSVGKSGVVLQPYYAGGIVVSPDESRMYIAELKGLVGVYNILTNQEITTIPENGYLPAGISLSPDGKNVYVLDHTLGMEVSVINTITNTIIANIPVPNPSTALSTSADGALIYVANSANITVISTATNMVVGTIPLGSIQLLPNKTTTGVSVSGNPVTFTITVNPRVNASAVNFTNTTFTGTTANWTNGNGTGVAVFIAKTSSGNAVPVNGTTYTANNTFGSGTQIGSTGWYCVYNGPANSVAISGLAAGTGYRFTAVAYTGTPGTEAYMGFDQNNLPGSRLSPANVTTPAYGLPTVNTIANQTVVSGTTTAPVNFTGTNSGVNWVNNTTAIGLQASGSGNIASFTAVNNGTSPITATVTATPVYPKTKYVISAGSGYVQVTDWLTGNVSDTLKYVYSVSRGGVILRPYLATGIVVSPDESQLYIAQSLGLVAVVNTSTKLEIVEIPENGFLPAGISISPDGKNVYVLDHTLGMEVSVINTVTNTIVTNIAVPNPSTALSTSADGAFIYVVNSSNITVISTATNMVVGTVPLGSITLLANKTTTGVSISGMPVKFSITVNPKINASAVKFTNTTTSATTATWTNGNGAGVAVFIAKTANGSAAPISGTTYSASTTFAAGDQVGTTGWYCVYNGTGSAVNIAGLTAGTTYRVTAVEYSTVGGVQTYLTTGVSPASFTTVKIYPTLPALQVKFTNTTSQTTTATWINGDGARRAAFIHTGINGSALPLDNTTYTANTKFGSGMQIGTSGWYCIYDGTGSTVNITGLTIYSSYRVTVVEYNGTPGSQKYAVTSLSPGNVYTNALPSLNSLYLPGNGGQTASVFSLNSEKVEANNILSPNGDGINDIWVVKNIAFYPDNTVTVYDKAGQVVFTKKSYANDWDGTYRGSILNSGTYYYLVDLGNGSTVKGFITVVGNK